MRQETQKKDKSNSVLSPPTYMVLHDPIPIRNLLQHKSLALSMAFKHIPCP